MATLENSIGVGISKAQGKLDELKVKGEISQEVSALTKSTEEINFRKTKSLIELGELVYQNVREKKETNQEIIDACQCLIGFDYLIYKNNKEIANLQKSEQGTLCECGEYYFTKDDLFCSHCGNPVNKVVETVNTLTCETCHTDIDINLNYCPCCGIKIH